MKTKTFFQKSLFIVLTLFSQVSYSSPFRFVREDWHNYYMSLLPKTNDEQLRKLFQQEIIFYTDTYVPKAHQDFESGLTGLHSPHYNISANGAEPFGNANIEFPWGEPAGTDLSIREHKTVEHVKFLIMPKNPDDTYVPIIYYGSPLVRWVYPIGIVFGEILLIKDPTEPEKLYPFELRIRQKVGTPQENSWATDVFRPYSKPSQLLELVKQTAELVKINPEEDKTLKTFLEHLSKPDSAFSVVSFSSYLSFIRLAQEKLGSRGKASIPNNQEGRVLSQSAVVDILPPLNAEIVKSILSTAPFIRVEHGDFWRRKETSYAFSPSTAETFHIVPSSYLGAFLPVDQGSCMNCHNTTGMLTREFDLAPRDWYGRVRGFDGIFSFHIFEPTSISRNGSSSTPQVSGALIKAGIVSHR